MKSWIWLVVYSGADWRVSMYVQVAVIAATIVLVAHYITGSAAPDKRVAAVFSIALALGSARQHENLFWAMQISSAAMVLFSLLAFILVARFAETQSTRLAALAVAAGVLALLSNGGGMLSFPIVIAALTITSKKHWQRIIFIAIGASALLILFHHMSYISHGEKQIGGMNALRYILAFFSNALTSFGGRFRGPNYSSIVLGAMIAALTVYTVIFSWKIREKLVFPYLVIAFSLALAASLVYSRGSIGLPQESRYYPFAALLLVGNILIISSSKAVLQRRLLYTLSFLIAISFTQSYFRQYRHAPRRHAHAAQAYSLICSGDIRGLQEQLFRLDPQHHTNMEVMQAVFCTPTAANPIPTK